MDWQSFLWNPAVVWVLIPLSAILLGGIQSLAKMYFTHQERIAMIDQGIHPDQVVADQQETAKNDWTS